MGLLTFMTGATLATGITYIWTKQPKRKEDVSREFTKQPTIALLPQGLGFYSYTHAEEIEQQLERAMDSTYFHAVKERILRKNLLRASEYDVYFLELKRYFVLTTLMKSVPMYNEKVDIIWHEMLMFTKSYDAFCLQFMGSKIHHEPNINPVPNKEEKGLFDFMYTYFFQTHQATDMMYPSLQKEALSKAFITLLATEPTERIIANYFAPTGRAQYQVLRLMIEQLKNEIECAKKLKKRPTHLPIQSTTSSKDGYYSSNDLLLYQMMSHSMIDFPEEKPLASASYEQTARSSNQDDHSSSSKHSCSSSSCSSSSCGSSCSS